MNFMTLHTLNHGFTQVIQSIQPLNFHQKQRIKEIPHCLRDPTPDRCGALIQKRKTGYAPPLTKYLLRVSDYFRM